METNPSGLNFRTEDHLRNLTLARVERDYGTSRASSSMSETRRKTDDRSSASDAEESDNVSVWDSNAEGIRGSWRTSRTSSFGSGPIQEPPDYASDPEDNWQWWRSGPDDDDYEGDDEEEEDSIFSFFNLDNFDVLSAISLLRWMLPAAAFILPWLFGGPMFLMVSFAFFPLAQKLLGFFLPDAWKAAFRGSNSSSSRSRQKKGKRSQFSSQRTEASSSAGFWTQMGNNLREESSFIDADNEDWERSYVKNSLNQGQTSKLGGWEEYEDSLILRNVKRGSKKTALQRRRNRKEAPLFFRLLVALFPFLRSWGGFL